MFCHMFLMIVSMGQEVKDSIADGLTESQIQKFGAEFVWNSGVGSFN